MAQREFEAEAQARLDAARQKRQEEKERQEALEVCLFHCCAERHVLIFIALQRAKMEELRQQAEKLAGERRIAREQALEWTREVQMESDEERERKSKRSSKKVKVEAESGDEGLATPSEPKKKRKGKLKRSGDQGGEENEQLFSDEEVENKPAKKVRGDWTWGYYDSLITLDSGARRSGSFVMTKIKRRQVARGRNNCAFLRLGCAYPDWTDFLFLLL